VKAGGWGMDILKEEKKMATQNIERRVEVLEVALRVGEKPDTVEDMFRAMERGDYGPCSVMSVIAAMLSNGGNADGLRGSLPDQLIEYFVEAIKRVNAET